MMPSRCLPALVLGAVLLVMGCRLGGETRYEDTITFPDLYDSLKQYERAVIIFTNGDGRVLDTVFNGPVGNAEQLRGLALENWDGGDATIRIIGISGGREVYLLEKRIDGATRRTESTVLVRTPAAVLGAAVREYLLLEGDSLPIPDVAVGPADLADKSLLWSSSHPDIVAVGAAHLKGLRQGAAQLTVRLKSDDSKSLFILVKVGFDARIPERIAIVPDTLRVAAGGAPQRAVAKASPASADAAVLWSLDDPGVATVQADGNVRGLRKGVTRLRAASKWKAAIAASAVVHVSDPVPAQKVRFLADSTGLYLGGAPESLRVEVLPPEANPGVTLLSLSPEVAAVRGGRLHALAEGRTSVLAVSIENPALADTLPVRVSPAPGVDSVRIAPRRLTLYVGGDAGSLAARVSPPTAPEDVRWLSGNPSLARADAAGRVIPLAAGNLRVYAVSAADSLARDSVEVGIKVDAPVVAVGADTVLPVGGTLVVLPVVAPQAFGVVTAFKWDLDGDLAWDDSAAAVKSVSRRYDAEATHVTRYLVRDTEGNETLVRKQVRAVKGRIVRILSPGDNSYVRESRIAVRWSVDGIEQDSLTTQTLAEGPNVLTRSVTDSAGRPVTATVLVTLDAVPPPSPAVRGPDWVRTSLPSWSWASGGGGSGEFRCALDAETFPSGSETRDTVYVPAEGLAEGPHTLYVQERDAAGNWSTSGRHTLRVDLTPPGRPTALVEPGNPTNVPKPTFRWQSGGGGMGLFQFKLDSAAFGDPTAGLSFMPSANLAAGGHVFTIRERDSAGHWSAPASLTVTLDFTAPEPPKISGASPTSAPPRWTWASGGNGGSGDFRFKVGSDGNPANGGTESRALEYVLPAAVSGTSYTLYVQERDGAGNWSTIASLPVVYDLTRPAVTIRTPQSAGTYLTRQPAVDVSGTSSKPEGGSPVEAITYTLGGVAGALPTNLAADGTWIIRGLPLTNNQTVELKVTARDQSGNSGDAILLLAMDSTPPAPPVFTAGPPATVNAADTRTTLAWTWTRTGAATDSFVVRLNGAVVARQTDTSYSIGSLSDGAYALQISELDLAGNLSAPVSAAPVTVDRTPTPAPGPTAASPTRDNTPTWTWSRTGSSAFEYRLARDAAPTGAGTALADTLYTPATALADGAWQFQVRARDAAGNWSPWSNSATVVVKAAAPAAPVVNRNAAASNAPQWTWVSGGGGNGTFRYHWSGVTTFLGEGTAASYAPTGLPEQAHSLCVAERDVVGYGPEACLGITVDRTPPVIAGYNVADGFITNRSPLTIRFTRDGVADSLSCALTDGGSRSCQKSVSDAAGNSANATRTIWYRSNVVFVKAGQTGTRGGSSWEDAFPEIRSAIVNIDGRIGRVEIWVTEGEYGSFKLERSNTSIYGGFRSSGNPSSIGDRDPSQNRTEIVVDSTLINAIQIGWNANICYDAILDGLHVMKSTMTPISIWLAENVKLKNIWLEENVSPNYGFPAVRISDGSHVFDSVFIRYNSSDAEGSVQIFDGNLEISNSEIFNNRCNSCGSEGINTSGIFSMSNGRVIIRNTRLQRNASSNPNYQVVNLGEGAIDIDECIVEGLRNGIFPQIESPRIIWGSANTDR